MDPSLKLLKGELRRFLIGGVVNTGFSYGVYAALLYLDMTYLISNLIAAIAGTLFSFNVSKSYVFQRGSWRNYGKFLVAWIFVWMVGSISLVVYIEGFGFSPLFAGVATLPITAGVGYLVQRFYVFRKAASPSAHERQSYLNR